MPTKKLSRKAAKDSEAVAETNDSAETEASTPELSIGAETETEIFVVELLEGSSYKVAGVEFLANRPQVIANPTVLSCVRGSSRFRCRPHVKVIAASAVVEEPETDDEGKEVDE